MSGDAAREKLAAALVQFADEHGLGFSPWEHGRFAEALLPVVREIAAEELRAAADAIALALPGFIGRIDTADALRDRADALHPGQAT